MSDLPLEEVRACVSRAGLPDARIVCFGSRVAGNARPGSDLDIAVDMGRPLTFAELARIREAFDDSDLPMRVDASDFTRLEPAFRDRALRDAVAVR